MNGSKKQICSRCILDENTPGITFDENEICNFCHLVDHFKKEYGTGTAKGESRFVEIVERIKEEGKNRKYDCVLGVSGGTDSSYMLYLAKEYGLRPLAVHYDNTWNTAIATENIRKITSKLDVDLETYVVDNKESDDIFKSFFYACVPELDGPTDLALAEVLYRVAAKIKVKYVIEAHSFMAEGLSPLKSTYIDGKYINTIHKKFGKIKMKTFPNMKFSSFIKWVAVKRIRKIRPLWYLNYSKEKAREILRKEFGWEYYGGHHLENRMTALTHLVWLPKKFNIDLRNIPLAASVRIGEMSRDDALKAFKKSTQIEPELVDYFKKRLSLTDKEFDSIISAPNKYYYDYKTYKKRFERLRPFFFLLAKSNLVPMSFYFKYTLKDGKI